MKRLLLMRHGKAEYPDDHGSDFERRLVDRGRREARLTGAWITENLGAVDAVFCSSATRTRETFAALGVDATVTFHDEIYEGSRGELLTLVQTAPQDANTIMVVGHVPGVPALAALLASDDSDAEALGDLRAGFPTAALAVLEVHGPWTSLDPGTATLVGVVVPR